MNYKYILHQIFDKFEILFGLYFETFKILKVRLV